MTADSPLATDVTRAPEPFDAEQAEEVEAIAARFDPQLAEVLRGTAGCSPYLRRLLQREADWLEGAVAAPRAALAALPKQVPAPPADPGPDLRQGKRRLALLTALADLGGAWVLEQVTGALTDFAGAATDIALRAAIAVQVKRGKLPVDDATGGLFALAMGKMGAGELNYSSDIDLIMLFDDERFDADSFATVRPALIRATRAMAATLGDVTGDGYVFRTDLRLRPDPAVTPVCLAVSAAERYYESLGRTWERAAYIKARACAGDIAAGEAFLKTLVPFVWRRHLDFAAIQDAHDMRLRIRAHKGRGRAASGPISLPGHDMKLGRGGIREIEFFTQTRQIIAGGRDASLRLRGTVPALKALAAKDWVPPDVATRLTDIYRRHREVEHRLQMINDAQTHLLPTGDEGWHRLAAFMGMERRALERRLSDDLAEVEATVLSLYAPGADPATAPPQAAPQSHDEDAFDPAILSRWPTYPALRSDRAREIFRRLRPEILRRLSGAARPDEALIAFDAFLAGLPAGVQILSLFEANPQLVDLLVDICTTAPSLGGYLGRNSAVFDAVIGGDFFAPWPGQAALLADLAPRLAAAPDYEAALIETRRWAREWHFRIGVHHLRGLEDAGTTARHYADLAETCVAGLWPVVAQNLAAKHGPPPGRGAVVMGMGSLGARRLNARSDLDLIVIYDPAGAEMSDGRRPLPVRQYYARLTQALVTALSAQMAGGRLYEVDMRLRPSGTQGPVATSFDSFRSYQREKAWTWEHLALTRARVVAGPAPLSAEVEAFRAEVLAEAARRPQARESVLRDVAEMRARIRAAKAPSGPLDAKIGPGRLQDIELIAQAGLLLAGCADRDIATGLEKGAALGLWPEAAARDLTEHAGRLWTLQASARLLTEAPLDPETLGIAGRRFLLEKTGAEDMDSLIAKLDAASARAAALIDTALSGASDAKAVP